MPKGLTGLSVSGDHLLQRGLRRRLPSFEGTAFFARGRDADQTCMLVDSRARHVRAFRVAGKKLNRFPMREENRPHEGSTNNSTKQ